MMKLLIGIIRLKLVHALVKVFLKNKKFKNKNLVAFIAELVLSSLALKKKKKE